MAKGRKEGSTCFLAVPMKELVKVLGEDAIVQVGKKWFVDFNIARMESGQAFSFIPASPVTKTAGEVEEEEEEESEPDIQIS